MRLISFLLILCSLLLVTGGCSTTTKGRASITLTGQASYLSVSGTTIHATYYTDNTVNLKFSDNSSLILPIAVTGSGARYANDRYEWWEHQGEATYFIDGKVVFVGNIQK
jgi:membrane-bound inhibitor of C-type lysozyme